MDFRFRKSVKSWAVHAVTRFGPASLLTSPVPPQFP